MCEEIKFWVPRRHQDLSHTHAHLHPSRSSHTHTCTPPSHILHTLSHTYMHSHSHIRIHTHSHSHTSHYTHTFTHTHTHTGVVASHLPIQLSYQTGRNGFPISRTVTFSLWSLFLLSVAPSFTASSAGRPWSVPRRPVHPST